MDVPEHFLPPGRHLLDAAGCPAVDGLAATFSRKVEMGRVGQAAAYLFSIAERSLVTVSSAADVLAAEQTAVEALNLFVAAQDQQGVAWAMRLVIHAVRTGAQRRCESPANVYEALESFLEEELRRARLFEDHFAEAAALLSLAEVKLDQAHYEKCLELAQAARQIFESDNAAGCRLGQGLCWLRTAEAQLRSYQFHQGQDSASRALHCFNGTDHAHSIGRARFLLAAGLRLQQKHAAVVSAVKEALPLAQEAGDQRLLAGLMYLLACSCYQKGGRFREAAQAATEALQLCLETGEVWGFAEMSLAVKVKALWSESSQQLAMDALQQHMRRARDFASRLLTRQVWVQLFKRMDGPTELQKAHAICDKNLVALRAKSTQGTQGTQGAEWQARELELIASLHSKVNTRKKVEEALQWALQAKQQLHLSGQKYLEADAIPSIANCHILLGEATKASSVLSERRQLFRDLNARSREAEAMLELADALCREQVSRVDSRARRFLRDSFQICQDALNAFSDVGHETGMAKAHLLLADIYLYRQEPEEAEKEARRAEQLYREAGEAKLVAKAVRKLGLALCERDLPQEAARSASEAVVFCKKAGDRYALADTLGWEAQMHSQNVGKNIEGLPEKDAQKIVFRSLSKLMTPAKEAVLLARKLQDKGLIASTLCSVGEVEASVGKWDAALCATAEAAVLSQKIADCATESRALVLSSEIHFRKKEFVLARDEAERAFKLVKNTFSWEARRNAEKALKRTGGCASYDES